MKENEENEKVFDQERLKDQLELASMEVVDAEVVSGEDTVEVTVEEDEYPAMQNIPYVKIENEDGDILNPINGSYPNFFPNRKQRRDAMARATKNPKNNKKGARVVITKLGDASFTKTHVKQQTIESSKKPIIAENMEFLGWKHNKRRTIIHNQVQ